MPYLSLIFLIFRKNQKSYLKFTIITAIFILRCKNEYILCLKKKLYSKIRFNHLKCVLYFCNNGLMHDTYPVIFPRVLVGNFLVNRSCKCFPSFIKVTSVIQFALFDRKSKDVLFCPINARTVPIWQL